MKNVKLKGTDVVIGRSPTGVRLSVHEVRTLRRIETDIRLAKLNMAHRLTEELWNRNWIDHNDRTDCFWKLCDEIQDNFRNH